MDNATNREEALRLCLECGFEPAHDFIMGGVDVEDIIALIKLVRQSSPRSSDAGAQYCELAQSAPQQEPVGNVVQPGYAYVIVSLPVGTSLYDSPPAQPQAVPEGLEFARTRGMAVTDEWVRGWEGARQYALGNTGPEALSAAPKPAAQSDAEAARDALRYRQINTPEIHDFIVAIEREALHQRERWAQHDAGKTCADWFWLVGFLAGKALHKPEKRLHHIITAAAACLNWHAHALGIHTAMRPGIYGDAALQAQGREGE